MESIGIEAKSFHNLSTEKPLYLSMFCWVSSPTYPFYEPDQKQFDSDDIWPSLSALVTVIGVSFSTRANRPMSMVVRLGAPQSSDLAGRWFRKLRGSHPLVCIRQKCLPRLLRRMLKIQPRGKGCFQRQNHET